MFKTQRGDMKSYYTCLLFDCFWIVVEVFIGIRKKFQNLLPLISKFKNIYMTIFEEEKALTILTFRMSVCCLKQVRYFTFTHKFWQDWGLLLGFKKNNMWRYNCFDGLCSNISILALLDNISFRLSVPARATSITHLGFLRKREPLWHQN